MAFTKAQEVMGQSVRWTEQPKNADDKSIYLGTVIQGFYKGMKTGVGQNESNIYEILLPNGQVVGIWGSGLLDGKFETGGPNGRPIPIGCEVRITYLGISQPKTPKGRPYQNFLVEFDETSKMPMVAANAPAQTGATAPARSTTTAAPVAPAQPAAPQPSAGQNGAGFGEGF